MRQTVETKSKFKDLIGRDLSGFKIVKMAEVYSLDEDGRKSISLGFFRDQDIASAFAEVQNDGVTHHRMGYAFILTDGNVGCVIGEQEPVKLFNDEEEVPIIRQKVIDKLSPAERKILGLAK